MQQWPIKTGIPAGIHGAEEWTAKIPASLADILRIEPVFVEINSESPIYPQLNRAFIDYGIEAFIMPLELLPVSPDKHLTISALTERQEPAISFYLRKSVIDPTQDFRLALNTRVLVSGIRFKHQLHFYRPDLQITVEKDAKNILSEFKENNYDAFIIPDSFDNFETENHSDFEKIVLNPSEMIQAPGAGALALVAEKTNIPLRKHLSKIHHHETAICTNIERGIQQLVPEKFRKLLSAHAQKIGQNNYQIAASFGDADIIPFQRINLTSATYVGLAENVGKQLKISAES
jgi:hydroxymethylbilane synthase